MAALTLKDPPAAMAELENPYDTAARQAAAPDALWDVAYYNGRYYVYFGIVPCLLFQLPFEALTGIRDLPPALPMILLAWLYILAVFGFVKQAARRWFPQASAAAYLLTAAGAASGTQIYYLLHRPSVYEYAILCGATFVLWALWQWLCAANTPVKRRKALTFHLAFGSLCMALVAGCRPQMVLFAALALPILWPRYITEKRLCTRRGAGEAAAFILPVVLVAVGFMWYNAARFGSPFDFGANYNLTSNDMTRRGFAVGRIAPAAVTFLAGIPGVQTVFPYLTATRMQTNYMGLTITELYYGGAFACLPLLWGLAALPLARRRLGSCRDLRTVIRACARLHGSAGRRRLPDGRNALPLPERLARPAAAGGGAGVALCGKCPAGPPHPRADQSSAHGAAAGRAGGRLLQFLCLLCGGAAADGAEPCPV